MSQCECDGAAPNAFYRRKTVTARKEYRCGEESCETVIAIGARYVYHAGKSLDDGGFWEFRSCLNCDEARQRLDNLVYAAREEPCGCFGRLFEAIEEAIDNGCMEDREDDPDLLWLVEHGYLPKECAIGRDDDNPDDFDLCLGGDAEERDGGYIDPYDERQLALPLTWAESSTVSTA